MKTSATVLSARFVRKALSGVLLFIPLSIVIWSRVAWEPFLPPEIATHWSTNGPADRTTNADAFFTGVLWVLIVSSVVGLGFLIFARNGVVGRVSLLASGSLSGIAAAQWLISTWITILAGDPYLAVLGSWMLLHMISSVYGVAPMLVAPPPKKWAQLSVEK